MLTVEELIEVLKYYPSDAIIKVENIHRKVEDVIAIGKAVTLDMGTRW